MVQGADGTRLALESSHLSRRDRLLAANDLDRHIAAEPRIVRAVDLAHAAGADEIANLIAAQLRPRGQRADRRRRHIAGRQRDAHGRHRGLRTFVRVNQGLDFQAERLVTVARRGQ
jgi:hypothetical protein